MLRLARVGPCLICLLALMLVLPTARADTYQYVTVAGSFNGWSAGNTAFDMSLEADGIYRLTTQISAGDWGYVIATNHNWLETYGAGGQLATGPSSDIPLSLSEDSLVLFTFDRNTHISTANVVTAPVPEPASIMLLGTGLLGMLGAICRKIH